MKPAIRHLPSAICHLLFAICTLIGCRAQDQSLAHVRASGVLRVGLDPSWPPFESLNEQGELIGLDVDLARAIADRLGVQAQFVVSGWEGLIDALRVGQFDAAISALPYDAWRTRTVAYTAPYFNAGPVILTSDPNIRSPQDLAGRVVHVELGAESDVQARRLQKKGIALTLTAHDTPQAACAAAQAQAGHATIVDHVSARLFRREHPDLNILDEPLYDEPFVIAVPLSARSLREAIDQVLVDLGQSGELSQIESRWLD